MNQEAKPVLKKSYIKMECDKCKGAAYYIPLYSKKICPKCFDIPVIDPGIDLDTLTPVDFLSEKASSAIREMQNPTHTKYALRYNNPSEYPMKTLPDRNDKCICDSGLKFKKCCLPKIEEQRFKTIDGVRKKREDNEVLVLANTVKMINAVVRAFSNSNEESIPVEDVACIPFKNAAGELSDKTIAEGNMVQDKEVTL